MPLRFRILPAPAGRDPAVVPPPAGLPGGARDEGPLQELTCELLDDLEEVQIGRRTGAELELPFPGVSVRHARLFRGQLPADWWVEDLGSTNGSWLDGERLDPARPRPLRPGQRLRLGTVDTIFEGWSSDPRGGESTATLARRLIRDLIGGAGGGAPQLAVESGASAEPLRLVERDRLYRVGRAESCDLPLLVEHVSREHAVFVRGWGGVTVRDRTSKNGVEVNGRRITGEVRLADGDRVQIGPVALVLSDPEDRYLSRVGRADEPARSPTAAVDIAPKLPRGAVTATRTTLHPVLSPPARRGLTLHRAGVLLAGAVVVGALATLLLLLLGAL